MAEETNKSDIFIEVLQVSFKMVAPWILLKHYAKRLPQIKWAYGLFKNGVLCGVVTFGRPASPYVCSGVCGKNYSKCVWELNRLIMSEPHGKNDTSILVSRALKQLPGGSVVISYADKGIGHVGYIYQATNWIYTGETKQRTDGAMTNGQHARHNKTANVDLSQRQLRTAKYRYVTFCGDKKTRQKLLSELRWPKIAPYPKGESVKSIAWTPIESNNNQGVLF